LNKLNYDNAAGDSKKYMKNALIQASFNIKIYIQ